MWIPVVVAVVVTAWATHLPQMQWIYLSPVVLPSPKGQGLSPGRAPSAPEPLPDLPFARSFLRFNRALNAFPDQSPADVLAAVIKRDRTCSFRLSNGDAALIYGPDKSIATTLDLCAAAIERFRIHGDGP